MASKSYKKRKRSAPAAVNESRLAGKLLLTVIMILSAVLFVSTLGFGGILGTAVGRILFGVMGKPAYAFPFCLLLLTFFLLSGTAVGLKAKKTAAGFIFFSFLCAFVQQLTEGYSISMSMRDCFDLCSEYKTGGGVIGGAVCYSTTMAFGKTGSILLIGIVMLVCLIVLTQRSFFEFLFGIIEWFTSAADTRRERYEEREPEREMRRELRDRRREQARRLRNEQRLRSLQQQKEALEREGPASYDEDDELQDIWTIDLKAQEKKAREKKAREKKEKRSQKPSFPGKKEYTDIDPENSADGIPVHGLNEGAGEFPGDVLTAGDEDDELESVLSEITFNNGRKDDRKSRGNTRTTERIPVKVDEPEEDDPYYDDVWTEDDLRGMEERIVPERGSAGAQDAQSGSRNTRKKTGRNENHKNNDKNEKNESVSVAQVDAERKKQEAAKPKVYHYPPLKLLDRGEGRAKGDSEEHLRNTARKLQETLYNFGVNAKVTNVSCGPTVTRYELQPEMGVKVSKIVGLADDIKLNLASADIRIEAPIPGKAAVGIEVPNKEVSPVLLRDLIASEAFKNARSKISFAVGKDIAGQPVVTDIAKMPHLLIAGATGSGKSVCINTLIISILYKASPEEVKMIMIDPKVVELSVYNGIPHLLIPVVTDPKKAAGALNWAVAEMTNRYNTFAEYHVRNISEYNKKIQEIAVPEGENPPERMYQMVVIVDELADLMMVAPGDVEEAICRLAQLARAAGIHLVIATQRPSVNVITGLIKANMPSRIAFAVSSGVDSRTILDMNGAEKLLGKGDMLFYPQGMPKPARLQGAFVSDEEVSDIVRFLTDRNPKTEYSEKIQQEVSQSAFQSGLPGGASMDERDNYFAEAGRFIIEKDKASIGMLQRIFKIGFNRAARIMDQLAEAGVVGPEEGTKARKILMSMEEFETYLQENG